MREQFMKMLDELNGGDVSSTPNMVASKAMFNRLMVKGAFTPKEVSEIVSHMKIEVGQSFIDDKELFEKTIETYALCVVKIWSAMYEIHPSFFWNIIKTQPITLSYPME